MSRCAQQLSIEFFFNVSTNLMYKKKHVVNFVVEK